MRLALFLMVCLPRREAGVIGVTGDWRGAEADPATRDSYSYRATGASDARGECARRRHYDTGGTRAGCCLSLASG